MILRDYNRLSLRRLSRRLYRTCRQGYSPRVSRRRRDHPVKVRFFVAALILAMAILWPVLLPSAVKTVARRKQRKIKQSIRLMGALADNGTDQDMIPGASGEFGLRQRTPFPLEPRWAAKPI